MWIKFLPKKILIQPFNTAGRRVLFHVILALIISSIINFFLGQTKLNQYLYTLSMYVANDIVFSLGHIMIFYNLDRHFGWLKQTTIRFILGAIFHLFYSAVAFYMVQAVMFNVLFDMNPQQVWQWYLEMWWVPLVITLVIVVFTTTLGFFYKWKHAMVEEERMKTEMMAYKFDSLKGQINASFLFKSLDSLRQLIQEDEKEASEVIQKMSRLYRSVLEYKDMELVSLTQELDLVNLYFDLLNLRYEDRLKYEILANSSKQDRVVPMVLQNVIECLLDQADQEVKISFILDRESINLKVISNIHIKEKLAIENLQKRYEFFTDNKITVESKVKGTDVVIPILIEEI